MSEPIYLNVRVKLTKPSTTGKSFVLLHFVLAFCLSRAVLFVVIRGVDPVLSIEMVCCEWCGEYANDVGGVFVGSEHDIPLGVSAYCSCFACMCGMGGSNDYTVANVEVGTTCWALCGLFDYLCCAIACVLKGPLDYYGGSSTLLRVLEELGGRKKMHSVLDVNAPRPMCIPNLNLLEWWYINSIPLCRL